MRFAQNTVRAKPFSLETGHAGCYAELLRLAVGCYYDAVAVPTAADPYRPALQFFVQGNLATGEETVTVNVQDADGRIHGFTYYFAPNLWLCQFCQEIVFVCGLLWPKNMWPMFNTGLLITRAELPNKLFDPGALVWLADWRYATCLTLAL